MQHRTRLSDHSFICSLFRCLLYRERLEQALKLANTSAEKERQKLLEERGSLEKQVCLRLSYSGKKTATSVP